MAGPYRYSKTSLERMNDVHQDLIRLAFEVIKVVDITILEGHRSVARQQKLYAIGRTEPGIVVTQIDGVNFKGKHNFIPARAIDWYLYPLNWKDKERFYYVGGIWLGIAHALGIKIRYGGDWDRDGQILDEKFTDLGHVEML